MSDLIRFEQDGIEILIDAATGEVYASIRGYCRMANTDKMTISRRLQRVSNGSVKSAEVLTPGGLQRVSLICESLIAEWLPKDNPEMATKIMLLGVRAVLYKMAGYEVKSSIIQTPQTYPEALRALADVYAEKEKLRIESEKLSNHNGILEIQNKNLNDFKDDVSKHPKFLELLEIARNEIGDDEYIKGVYTRQFLLLWNNDIKRVNERIDEKYWKTIAKRTSTTYYSNQGSYPYKNKKSQYIYFNKEVAFIMLNIRLYLNNNIFVK